MGAQRMDLKKARVCTWAVFLLGAAVILVSIFLRQGGIAVAGVLLLAAGALLKVCYWRCPHCGMLLPPREGNIRYCPYCGGKL